MIIHYLQHVSFEGLGCIEHWAKRPGNQLTATRFYEDVKLPFVDWFDMLIVMGGPMGVNDDVKYPWLKEEKKLIEKALQKDKKVVGICLGAQLIADVLGAKVYPNTFREIGWMPIHKTAEGKQQRIIKGLPDTLEVFHWHGDTFELPKGAIPLFSSEACPQQGFIYNGQVLAFQFHLEMTASSILQITEHGKADLVEGPYVKDSATFLNDEKLVSSNQYMYHIMNQLSKL
jgi:GMP synthase (glutamine-hydrolysing)